MNLLTRIGDLFEGMSLDGAACSLRLVRQGAENHPHASLANAKRSISGDVDLE